MTMKRDTFLKLSLSVCSILICLIIGEIGVRFIGTYDLDGNISVRSLDLKPYRLPVVGVKKRVEAYLAAAAESVNLYEYDSTLGWIQRPNSQSEDGRYYHNSMRIRTLPSVEYSILPQNDTLRIAIFGDSYSYGSQVPFENTWGYYLEDNLTKAGIDVEVMNFGAGAYGMDQAFLRWKKVGYKFHPHLVIFGLQMENVKRNVNLIRPLYAHSTKTPLAKPRFILNGGGLELINIPVVPPEQVPYILENFEAWEFAEYETFYRPENYQDNFWLQSKLVSFTLAAISREDTESYFYDLNEEPAQLTLRIIQEFRHDVEENGGKFLIVHLPTQYHLADILKDGKLRYSEMLDKMDEDHEVIHPEQNLLEEAENVSLDALFTKRHYAANANKVIADAITKYVMPTEGEMALDYE